MFKTSSTTVELGSTVFSQKEHEHVSNSRFKQKWMYGQDILMYFLHQFIALKLHL